jgi:hypothetical protein
LLVLSIEFFSFGTARDYGTIWYQLSR